MRIKIPTQAKDAFERFLAFLRARTKVGGLEISDTAIHFAYFKGKELRVVGLRLPPGIMENGEVKNYGQLVEALKKLRQQIPSDFPRRNYIEAVVTLSSIRIYIQVFTLPLIEGENLEEAIQLNIRMISPIELSQAYTGWQLVGRNESEFKLEILAAFANKMFIDQIDALLEESGFSATAVESGALSLVRLLRERAVGFESDKFYLLVSINDRGLQFLIVRRSQLHFEYFNSWKDIQGDKKEISWLDFEAAIKRNIHQVLNFYGTHWPEPFTKVFLLTNSFGEEISEIIRKNFSLTVNELRSNIEESIGREWFEVIGSALRAETARSQDRDINLFGVTVQEEFRRRQIVDFLKFWQVLVPSVLGVLSIVLVISYVFLANMRSSLESRPFSVADKRTEEIRSLQSQIDEFNRSVSIIFSVQNSLKPRTAVADKIVSLSGPGRLTINSLRLQRGDAAGLLSGEVKSQDELLNLKNALAADPMFKSVNLSLSDIRPTSNGISFTINFLLK